MDIVQVGLVEKPELYGLCGCDLRVVLYTYRWDEAGRGQFSNMD